MVIKPDLATLFSITKSSVHTELNGKRLTTRTSSCGIRIFEMEPLALQTIGIIQFGTSQIKETTHVNDQSCMINFECFLIGRCLFRVEIRVKVKLVGQPGATTTYDPNAKITVL